MKRINKVFNSKQLLFKQMFVGTLIYAVVLGFFDDYTSVVYAESFSTLFLAAFVLQVLTYLAFLLKTKIVQALKHRTQMMYRVLMFFCVWLVMFVSKFVFVWVIDLIFGYYIDIYGFFGILAIVLCVTVIHKLADTIFVRLGDS